jgi:hypothetical protein
MQQCIPTIVFAAFHASRETNVDFSRVKAVKKCHRCFIRGNPEIRDDGIFWQLG